MNPLAYILAALVLAAGIVLTLLGSGCASRPARVTDDLGRTWERVGTNEWYLRSQPAALDNPIIVPAPDQAF